MSINTDARKMLDFFVKYEKYFTKSELLDLQLILITKYIDDYNIMEKIAVSTTARSKFVGESMILKFLNNALHSKSDFERLKIIKLLNNFEFDFFSSESVQRDFALFYMQCFSNGSVELFKEENDKNVLFPFFKKNAENIDYEKLRELSHFENLQNILIDKFQKNNFEQHEIYFKYLYAFLYNYDASKSKLRSKSKDVLTAFLKNRTAEEITLCVESVCNIKDFFQDKSYIDALSDRAKTNHGFISKFKEYVNSEVLDLWLIGWLPVNSRKSVDDFVSAVNEAPNYEFSESLIAAILVESKRLSGIDDKRKLFNVIKDYCGKYEFTTKEFKEQLNELFVSANKKQHDLGFDIINEKISIYDKNELSTLAIKAINVFVSNLGDLHQPFKNVLNPIFNIPKEAVNYVFIQNKDAFVSCFSRYGQYLFKDFCSFLTDENKRELFVSVIEATYSSVNKDSHSLYSVIIKDLPDSDVELYKDKLKLVVFELLKLGGDVDIDTANSIVTRVQIDNFSNLGLTVLESLWNNARLSSSANKKLYASIFRINEPKLEIVSAKYFTNEDKLVDVKEKLQSLLKGNILFVKVSNELNGDPDPGTRKQLRVEYRTKKGGDVLVKTVSESMELIIP